MRQSPASHVFPSRGKVGERRWCEGGDVGVCGGGWRVIGMCGGNGWCPGAEGVEGGVSGGHVGGQVGRAGEEGGLEVVWWVIAPAARSGAH